METEPSSSPNVQPDIPDMREQLVILVCTGKAKEAIGLNLAWKIKILKSTTKGSRLTSGLRPLKPLLIPFTRCTPGRLRICADKKKTLKLCRLRHHKRVIQGFRKSCVKMLLMVANTALITTNHIDFSPVEPSHPSIC